MRYFAHFFSSRLACAQIPTGEKVFSANCETVANGNNAMTTAKLRYLGVFSIYFCFFDKLIPFRLRIIRFSLHTHTQTLLFLSAPLFPFRCCCLLKHFHSGDGEYLHRKFSSFLFASVLFNINNYSCSTPKCAFVLFPIIATLEPTIFFVQTFPHTLAGDASTFATHSHANRFLKCCIHSALD